MKAVKKDHPQATLNLAQCLSEGDGVEKDMEKANQLFEKAKDLGCVCASMTTSSGTPCPSPSP